MADRSQEAYPFAPYANGQAMTRSDAESSRTLELHKRKRIKCMIYIAVFLVLQIIVITVFALTVMKIKTPKFRISSISVQDLKTTNANGETPTFNMKCIAEVSIKNPNLGRYEYDQTMISFVYNGTQVGDAVVPKATARTKATSKEIVSGALQFVNQNLRSDISAGSVTLGTFSEIKGKVYLMNMIKKKKKTEMNCTMVVNLSNRQVHDIKCR